jgi:rhodanese-related sulfurtransferase
MGTLCERGEVCSPLTVRLAIQNPGQELDDQVASRDPLRLSGWGYNTMTILKSHGKIAFEVVWQGMAILLLASAIALFVNQLRLEGLPLVADWSPEAQLKLDSGDSLAISLDEVEALFISRSALFLDARSRDLFAEGHIQGAANLPWDEFDQSFALVMADIPQETPLVTYCDGESCGLSKDLAIALLEKGYTNVRVLVNGWTLWQEKNLPLELPATASTANP